MPLAHADSAAYGIMEDVTYGFAYGAVDSMHVSVGPSFDGESELPVNGCSVAIIAPKQNNFEGRGRVRSFAFFGGSAVTVDFHNTTHLLQLKDVDGSLDHSGPQHPKVQAELAMYGNAEMYVDDIAYFDPATLEPQFKASYFFTPTGFRNEGVVYKEGGGIFAPGDPALLEDRWEAHLRVEGAPGTSNTILQASVPPDGLLPGRFTANSEYRGGFEFYNQHFNGEATLDVDFEADAPEGMNELSFRVRAPNGDIIANETVRAGLLAPDSATLDFPLAQFGFYYVEVTGQVTLSQYHYTLEQRSTEPFDLWFWWENTTVGVPAWQEFNGCYDYVGEPNAAVASIVGRIPPPQMNVMLLVLGLLGTLAVLLVGGRLFGQTVVEARFKNTHRRR